MERCFGLNATPFFIAYVDDDSETISITNEADLTEAINYFKPTSTEDPPLSSAASILSGRSFRSSRITLRVNIIVDYDGISLSDTGSLVSLEEYKNRNGSGFSLSYSAEPREVEDDAITVSSKDIGSKYEAYKAKGTKTIVAGASREPLIDPGDKWETGTVSSAPRTTSSKRTRDPFFSDTDSLTRHSDGPTSVFARLKLEEERLGLSPGNLNGASTFQTERWANWLRDQSAHISVLNGDVGSISDFSLEDNMSLELEQNQHGNYRYTLTGSSGSAASQSVRDYGYDDGSSAGDHAPESIADSVEKMLDSRPTSMQATQFSHPHRSSVQSNQNPFMAPGEEPSYPSGYIHPDIPPVVLSFLHPNPLAPPSDPTNCSNCGVLLDMIKYVCSTCGEIRPPEEPEWTDDTKGKTRAIDIHVHLEHSYPPWRNSPSASASSITFVGSQHSSQKSISSMSSSSEHPPSRSMSLSDNSLLHPPPPRKPLPSVPRVTISQPTLGNLRVPGAMPPRPPGYELCSMCVQGYGVQHSLEFSATPGASPGPGTSPEDAERALSRWRRTAPSQKGVLRHAYIEKSWTQHGWEDVGEYFSVLRRGPFRCGVGCAWSVHVSYSDLAGLTHAGTDPGGDGTCHCSTCNTVITSHRYKCASCDDFNLCRACYSCVLRGKQSVAQRLLTLYIRRQVYEVHPAHAFLEVPRKSSSSQSSGSGTAKAEFARQSASLEEPCKFGPTLLNLLWSLTEVFTLAMTHVGVHCAQ